MPVVYDRNSMYRNTPVNEKYLDLYVPAISTVDKSVNTREVTIDQKYHRRPDLMAHDMFGNSKLAWIFHVYNRDTIVDPLYDFTTGKTIIVPVNSQTSGL